MTIYLVRHAVAVGRSAWHGDDRLRPLTKKGERQARGLVELLAGSDVHRASSSPAVRCHDTVAPLASKLGLTVHEADELAEGARPKGALHLAQQLAAEDGDGVLCTHGDVIPEVLRRLAREGMRWDGELRFAKGSTWALSWDGERFTDGRYLPPCEAG
jgi:broad specificity phosphatase PhoE